MYLTPPKTFKMQLEYTHRIKRYTSILKKSIYHHHNVKILSFKKATTDTFNNFYFPLIDLYNQQIKLKLSLKQKKK